MAGRGPLSCSAAAGDAMSQQVAVEVIEAPPVSVEVIEEGGVLVLEIDRPIPVEVVEVIHPGPQGPPAELPDFIDGGTFN